MATRTYCDYCGSTMLYQTHDADGDSVDCLTCGAVYWATPPPPVLPPEAFGKRRGRKRKDRSSEVA